MRRDLPPHWDHRPVDSWFPQACNKCDFVAENPNELTEHNENADHNPTWD
jgi:hypothetical protein